MRTCFILIVLFSLNSYAEVSRAPAVVGGTCDLDIPTTRVRTDSKMVFSDETSHLVQILPEAEGECDKLPQKKYPLKKYEEYAHNEMELLFRKYTDVYSRKCHDYFKSKGMKNNEYKCISPTVDSVTFNRFVCEKRLSTAFATIKFKQVGYIEEERPIAEVLKEQCIRARECLEVASDAEAVELKKLSMVACKNDLTVPSSGRAPALAKDESFDGKRLPKDKEDSLEILKSKESNMGK